MTSKLSFEEQIFSKKLNMKIPNQITLEKWKQMSLSE